MGVILTLLCYNIKKERKKSAENAHSSLQVSKMLLFKQKTSGEEKGY
jgi:hypothetical protein